MTRRPAHRLAATASTVGLAAALLLAGCGSGSKHDTGSTETTSASSAPAPCPPTDGSATRRTDFPAAPKLCIDPAKTYTATVTTSEGTFALKFDTKRTPKTTNNFVYLARYKYFDNTKVFRTEADTGIIQAGSPHTEGADDPGPGYTIPDEGGTFTTKDYGPGTLAMARSSEPNSGGSQFFLLASEGGRYLGDSAQIGPSAGSYVVFGKVTSGLQTLVKIASLQGGIDPNTQLGIPSHPITIKTVRITES